MQPLVIENVLEQGLFDNLHAHFRSTHFAPLAKGNGTFMYIAPVANEVDAIFNSIIQKAIGKRVESMYTFARLNTGTLDTDFRVHADSRIYGKLPDIAAVFYFNTAEDCGTALYEHPEYGRKPTHERYQIITKDDGKWTPYFINVQKSNTVLIYDAQCYHGRFPWRSFGERSTDGRIIIVKFMRTVE